MQPLQFSTVGNGHNPPPDRSFPLPRWLGVGLVIKRSLVRLPAGALSSHLCELSLPSPRGR